MDKGVRALRLGLVTALLTFGSLATASPAGASEANPMPCPEELAALVNIPDPQAAGIVIIGPSIEIHPENAAAYAGALTSHLVQYSRPYADCLSRPVLDAGQDVIDAVNETREDVNCALRVFTGHTINPTSGDFYYASVDYQTGAVKVHQSLLMDDIGDAALCFLATTEP